MRSLVLRGEKDGAAFTIKQGAVHIVGRAEGVDVRLPVVVVDKRHAELDFTGDTCLVNDVGSTSGTYLNGAIVRKPTPLKAGDSLRIGGYTLLVDRYS